VALGLILVPLSAFAASVLVDRATDTGVETTVSSPTDSAALATVDTLAADADGDLIEACGEAGSEMVALEAEGTISALQQAALDALRPICADHGLALPAPPKPSPVTETVLVAELQPLPDLQPPATGSDDHDDDEDDDHEDDDHEDDEDDDHEDDGEDD
jgi:hypothetical protein